MPTNSLLPPLSPADVPQVGAGMARLYHSHHRAQALDSTSSLEQLALAATAVTAAGVVVPTRSGAGTPTRRRGSFSIFGHMQPPKKRFMQSMEDNSSTPSADEPSSKSLSNGGADSGHSHSGNGQRSSAASASSDASTVTPKETAHVDSDVSILLHQSSRRQISPNLAEANQYSRGVLNSVIVNAQHLIAHSHIPSSQRSNSTETIAAYELSPYLHLQHQQQQQQQLHHVSSASGALLPSVSAPSFPQASAGGSLSNGLPTSHATSGPSIR